MCFFLSFVLCFSARSYIFRNFLTSNTHIILSGLMAHALLLMFQVVTIWMLALLSSIPFLIFYDVVEYYDQKYCTKTYKQFNDKAYAFTNFVLWYLMPLLLMSVMYTRISVVLWRSSQREQLNAKPALRAMRSKEKPRRLMKLASSMAGNSKPVQTNGTGYTIQFDKNASDSQGVPQVKCRIMVECEGELSTAHSSVSKDSCYSEDSSPISGSCSTDVVSPVRDFKTSLLFSQKPSCKIKGNLMKIQKPCSKATQNAARVTQSNKILSRSSSFNSESVAKSVRFVDRGERALLARRRVIRLLIAVVLAFAFCVLPSHVYHIWQQIGNTASISLFTSTLLPPTTYLILYLNSALNPLLYAFLSGNFRKSLKDVIGSIRRRTVYRNRHLRGTTSVKTANTLI